MYVLVTNPCDVLTVVAQRITGLPYQRVLSSGTVLDTSRLRWLIGNEAQVNTSSVHAYIIGEHGDTEFGLVLDDHRSGCLCGSGRWTGAVPSPRSVSRCCAQGWSTPPTA